MQFSAEVLSRLPKVKTNEGELLQDMTKIYSEILHGVQDTQSMLFLNCLFTISFFMMVRYKETPVLSSHIAYHFELISYRLQSWRLLQDEVQRERGENTETNRPAPGISIGSLF